MEGLIYIPKLDFKYCEWYNSETIRCYENNNFEQYSKYRDYFINSHYLYREGTRRYTLETIDLIPQENLTTEFYYRNDLSDILLSFFIIILFCFYFPYKIISRIFGKNLRIS